MRRLFFSLLLIMFISNCEKIRLEQEEVDQKIINNTDELLTVIEKGKIVYFAKTNQKQIGPSPIVSATNNIKLYNDNNILHYGILIISLSRMQI